MGRGDLSDEQWKLVKGLMPKQRRGGKWNDHRVTLDGILWILRTGAPWRDLPERYGKWKSVYDRFNKWRKSGMYERILKALRIRLDKDGKIDWDLWLVDGSNVRGSGRGGGRQKRGEKEPRDHALGRSRGGWGSKFHLVTDGQAVPLTAIISAGQTHESTRFVEVMEKVRPPRWAGWPLKTAGDKGYSYPRVRRWLQRRTITPVIPQRIDQIRRDGRLALDKRAYRKRARIENSVGWLKENRRIGTRYDKLAVNFQAFLDLAIIRRYLRILAPEDPSDTA